MELRESLPRSVYLRNHTNPTNNTTHECIEFIPIFSSGQYLELPLDESLSSSFVAVAPPGSISETDLIEKYLFVYAINEDVIYDANVSNRRKTIVDADFDNPNDGLMTLLFDSSELSSFSSQSVGRRYYTATGPVMWCYTHTHPHETGELVRYWDYALSVDPNVKPPLQTTGAQFEVMANNIANTAVSVPPFRVTEATLTRNNIVHIDLRLRRGETQEPLQLTREVFIPNVP